MGWHLGLMPGGHRAGEAARLAPSSPGGALVMAFQRSRWTAASGNARAEWAVQGVAQVSAGLSGAVSGTGRGRAAGAATGTVYDS